MSLIALHYNIIGKIGSGSFGTVYKIEDIWSKKLFAIKIFDKIPLADIQEKLMPDMMYKIINLSHKNLIRIFDYGIHQNNLSSLLEYFDGQSLQNFHLTESNKKEFLEIVVQTCYALHHLHSHNIIHKDLKLENILYKRINGKIRVKIYDFGFNKIISGTDTLSERDVVTLPYFPPEVLQGGMFSPQGDFYSLGIILYYLAVGAFPFSMEEMELMTKRKIPNIIPQFPSRINPAVDKGLEDLIFRMIEFNPNLRFKNSERIIWFINKTQGENFPLSLEEPLIEKIKSKRLKFRKASILSLKDYVKEAENGSGKIAFITGDYGTGKKESMLYLKWHLLSENYYIFYYHCSDLHRDPFFMLCKEIFTIQGKKDKQKFATKISEKFREFLFNSEENSLKLSEDKTAIQREFLLVKDYIYSFSKIKPVIYFISDLDMAEQPAVDFLNFISEDIHNYPILIVTSSDNPSLLDMVKNAVQVHLPTLSRDTTYEYIKYLLETDCSKDFSNKVYRLSNGNQVFIKYLLISLVKKKFIVDKNGKWNFEIDLEQVKLPSSIDAIIRKKMEEIPKEIYSFLTELSVLQVPLSPKIIKYILDFNTSKELFFFLKQSGDAGILIKDEIYADKGYYKFIYPAIKSILITEATASSKKAISEKVIRYFKDKKVTRLSIIDGIITHCKMAKDYNSLLEYQLSKTYYFCEKNDFINAWDSCYAAVKNLEKIKEKILTAKVKECLTPFMKLSDMVERNKPAIKYYQLWEKAIQPDFQMLWLYGKLLYKSEKYALSLKTLHSAQKIASSVQENDIAISLIELYTLSHRLQKSEEQIEEINPELLSPAQKVEFYLQKANFHYVSAEYKNAAESLELGERIAKKNSLLNGLAKIYKVLADTYNKQNLVKKADYYYKESVPISKKEGDLLNLANIFSHWGFLELKKGDLQNATEKFKMALHYFQILNYRQGIAEVNLNLAQTRYKQGEFHNSNKDFQEALKDAHAIKDVKLIKKITNKYSFLKLKTLPPALFLNFLQKNYTEFFQENKITTINSFLKNYIFCLAEIGQEKGIEKILKQIKEQKVSCILEQEFVLQAKGWVERSKCNFKQSIVLFKRAAALAKKNQNEYALMINYFNVSETYLIKGNVDRAEIYCDLGTSLATKNRFARWQNFAKILQSKILFKKPEIKLRVILRTLLNAEETAKRMNDWSLLCQSQFYIMLIYHILHFHKLEQLYKRKYTNRIAILTRGLGKNGQELLKNRFNYSLLESKKGIKEFIIPRIHISAVRLQHQFFDLLHLTSEERIKSSLKKYITKILGIEKFAIQLADGGQEGEKYWLNCGFKENTLTSEHQPYFEKVREKGKIQYYKIGKINYSLASLMLTSEMIGTVILADNGEMSFTKTEKLIIKLFVFYLTVILKKIGEYQEVMVQRENFSQLLTISRDVLQIMDLPELENQIVLNALRLSGAERGFFITLDKSNNFVFNTSLMKSGERIDKNSLKISKSILKDVYNTGLALSTLNAIEEGIFFDSDSINSYDLHSVYCAPINVNNSIFGFLYLDNLGSKQKILRFNGKLLEIFLLAAETSIKNSLDYKKLCDANEELLKLDQQRANFINISSHEFNTPIQTSRGYLNILKDEKVLPEVKANTIKIMERNINRLSNAINNVLQMNAIEQSSPQIIKKWIDIKDILNIVYEETKVLADTRKQKLILKITDDVKPVYGEQICLINAVKNLVFNAIKFTDDYGKITIGVRKSKFKNEEINGKESDIIYVEDNGIGIASYELDNIFKEFYEVADIKAHHSGLTEFKSSGLGLGLPITKSIVELFGGKIWAKSIKGEGSTFFIALPISNKETQGNK